MTLFTTCFMCRFWSHDIRAARIQNRNSFSSKMRRNEKWKKCLTNESKRMSFNIWCDGLMQFHERTFESFKNIFAMRRMQLKNLKFKKRNINRSRKSQNAKRNEKLWIYRKNEIVHAKTNESLHQDNNAKEKNLKTQLKKEKRKRKNTNIRMHTRNYRNASKRKTMTTINIVKTITLIINNFIYVNFDKFSQTWIIYSLIRQCERVSSWNDLHTQSHRRHFDVFDTLETSSMILRFHESRL